MTSTEQKIIKELYDTMISIKNENKELVDKLNKTITEINNKVDKKHIPITLEQDILQTVQSSMQKAIQEALTGYGNPLSKLVTKVVDDNSVELKSVIAESFNETIKLDEFKKSIKDGFSHKIARTIINNNDGLFDKVGNQLKQDPIFKSKMALAIDKVVNECLEK